VALLRRRGSDEEPELVAPAHASAQPVPEPQPAPEPAPVLPEPLPVAVEGTSRFQPVEGADEMLDMPLGTLIFRAGLIAPQQLEDALAEGLRTGKRLGEVLLARGWLSEEDLTRLLAGQKGLPFALPRDVVIDQELAGRLSYEDARRELALPLVVEFGVPVVAMADPSEDAMDRVRLLMGEDVRFVVSPASALVQAIDEVLGGVPAATAAGQSPLATSPAPGLAPIAALSETAVVPLGAPVASPERLAAIEPQQLEEVTPLVPADEIDYPSFGQYETLPEAEIITGPTEQLPAELQGDRLMDYPEEVYADAGGGQAVAAEEPGHQPEPAPAGPEAPADWLGNGAGGQPQLAEPGQWGAEPVSAASGPGPAWGDPVPVEPVLPAPVPAAERSAAEAEMAPSTDMAGEPADAVGGRPAEQPPRPAPESPPTESGTVAELPAWAVGEVSANAAELLAAIGGGEEESVADEPMPRADGPEPLEPAPVEPPADLEREILEPAPEPVSALGPEGTSAAHAAAPAIGAEEEGRGDLDAEPAAEPLPPDEPPAGAVVTSSTDYFEIILRLTDGERMSVDALPTSEDAQRRAREIIMQVAASEPGTWPFIAGRFLRPDTILSVDIESHAGWLGSAGRSRMFQS
jgi:hypothetical protein